MEHLASGLAAAAFALVHLLGARLDFLRSLPRSIWLSAAGGVSVAYVFVHILPDLAAHQREREHAGVLERLESSVWLLALAGLAAFYGLDRLARCRRGDDAVFWIHLGSFALYNLLIGYLLVDRESGLLAFTFAMALHFLVNDQGLRDHHGRAYARGRWLLAAAPVAGWALAVATEVPDLLLIGLFAFLAGGIILNVLKEELPEDRESRFSAFAAGIAGYAALLLAAA